MQQGRPRKYNTAEELEAACKEYFDNNKVLTITGLALALGFCDRQSLYDYEENEVFSCIVKAARLRVENGYEQRLLSEQGSPTGAIFALKNMGWKDKHETELSGDVGVVWQEQKNYIKK